MSLCFRLMIECCHNNPYRRWWDMGPELPLSQFYGRTFSLLFASSSFFLSHPHHRRRISLIFLRVFVLIIQHWIDHFIETYIYRTSSRRSSLCHLEIGQWQNIHSHQTKYQANNAIIESCYKAYKILSIPSITLPLQKRIFAAKSFHQSSVVSPSTHMYSFYYAIYKYSKLHHFKVDVKKEEKFKKMKNEAIFLPK